MLDFASMSIELSFKDEKLRTICESPVSSKRKLGDEIARTLRARLADLRAIGSPSEFVRMGLAKFDQNSDVQMVIPIGENNVVVTTIGHRPVPRFANGQVNWGQVSRLKILSIGCADES
ncbi:hypothetical protein [Pandoraea communis]|uniref:hypothetical protein n=1 Tax=Pandoraea communis TaxID=2508297 RepID=UPI001242698C|nr:hypothetical protein [Pandoraea communis]